MGYVRVGFGALAIEEQCSWAVIKDYSAPEKNNQVHCHEGGDNCHAKSGSKQAKIPDADHELPTSVGQNHELVSLLEDENIGEEAAQQCDPDFTPCNADPEAKNNCCTICSEVHGQPLKGRCYTFEN